MFKVFNSFQITVLFAASPFILEWVRNAEFYAANVVFWVGCAAYVVFMGIMTAVVANSVDEW